MLKKIFIVFFLFPFFIASAQADTSFRFIKKINPDVTTFAVDNLDNIFILNSRNQLKKLNVNGDSVAIYNDVKRFGQASLIDVSNPLKVLLYYKDFATVVMLDRFLNMRNSIDLRKQNIFQARVVAQSYDNKMWVYDELDNKLKKIDEEGKILSETPDFRLLSGEAVVPERIFDEDKYVYLYDPVKGVFVFDYFGTLKNRIQIYRWQNFKVAGNHIFGSRADTLFRYDIKTFLLDEWKMPEALQNARSFHFSATRLYALKADGIDIYEIK